MKFSRPKGEIWLLSILWALLGFGFLFLMVTGAIPILAGSVLSMLPLCSLAVWFNIKKVFILIIAIFSVSMTGSILMTLDKGLSIATVLNFSWQIYSVYVAYKWGVSDKTKEHTLATKGEVSSQSVNAGAKTCPNCGETYNPVDYRADTEVWICRECNKPLPRS